MQMVKKDCKGVRKGRIEPRGRMCGFRFRQRLGRVDLRVGNVVPFCARRGSRLSLVRARQLGARSTLRSTLLVSNNYFEVVLVKLTIDL